MTFLNASDFGILRDLASRWGRGWVSARYAAELDDALNAIDGRRRTGPDFHKAYVQADSIPELEAAALASAADLYGPDAKLVVEDIGTIDTAIIRSRGRFLTAVLVRCLNYEDVRQ